MSYINLPTEKVLHACEIYIEAYKTEQNIQIENAIEWQMKKRKFFKAKTRKIAEKRVKEDYHVPNMMENFYWTHRDSIINLFNLCVIAKSNNIEFINVTSKDIKYIYEYFK